MAARALVVFSTGAEGTSITPQDLADQAVAAGVPIYPVALPGFPWVLPYEGYTYRSPVKGGFFYFYVGLKNDEDGGNKSSMLGPGGVYLGKGHGGNCGPTSVLTTTTRLNSSEISPEGSASMP